MGYLRDAEELNQVLQAFIINEEAYFLQLVNEILLRLKQGRKILVFGNGGSASQAQHFAAELVNRYLQERAPIKAIALTTDTSILTSVANDSDFERVFARQIEALGEEGDIALGLTTSGRSPNIRAAFKTARQACLLTVCLTGEKGKELKNMVDYLLAVPSSSTPRIQEVHLFLLHKLAEELESRLAGR
jgi:D-sedoheptulose 7-phosphate isomerase